jgi:hypothetical protein
MTKAKAVHGSFKKITSSQDEAEIRKAPMFLPFPEWRPDVSDFRGASSLVIQNVVPRGDGYGPFADFQALTSGLPAPCRGYFFAPKSDGSVSIFAATASRLYNLNNTTLTWTDVSAGGLSYTSVAASRNWQFVQFNNLVFATQQNAPLQYFDLTGSAAFANALGAPPQADFIAVVNRFLVLSGLQGAPYRVQWSGLNNPNAASSWDNVSLQSNYQDLADGGRVSVISGGDQYGIVFQDGAIRTMTFNPGSTEVFDFFALTKGEGIFAPYSAVLAGGQTFFISTQGFKVIPPGGYPTPIGKEKFDRTFFANVDTANLELCIGAADPQSPRIYWAWKSTAGAAGQFDRILIYDHSLGRASAVAISGQYLANLAKPGLTLENLDAVAAGIIAVTGAANNGAGAIRLTLAAEVASWTYGQADTSHSAGAAGTTNLANASQNTIEVYGVQGTTEANGNWRYTVIDATHIDLVGSTFANAYVSGGAIGGALDSLTFSLDAVSTAAQTQLSGVSAGNAVGFYVGQSLAATLQTAEQGDALLRMRVQAVRPITDAAAALASVVWRDTLQAVPSMSTAQSINALGLCPQNVACRYARGQLVIPYGAAWTFASGIEPVLAVEGRQ